MKVLAFVVALLLLVRVLDLVRRQRLREEFSVLWVGGALGGLTLTVWAGGRETLARLLGADEGSALLTLAALFLLLIVLDLSTRVSRLANQQKHLIQEIARLEKRINDLEGQDD